MGSQDATATTYEVDSVVRASRVQTSADTRVLNFAARSPRPPARRRRSNAIVEIGENGLVDLRVDRVVRHLAEFALEYTGGKIEWAANELGVNPSTLRRWMYEWEREAAPAPALALLPGGTPEEAAS